MSGNPMGTNVVRMPATPPMAAPMSMPWPMPPGGFPAGCCPPGGMDALMQCYCDIQAAKAFISKIVQDLAATDPEFIQSIVDGIAASGSNIPLIGVTNGSQAQPGQVGEFVLLQTTQNVAIPAAGYQVFNLPLGVLQPGDWLCQSWVAVQVQLEAVSFGLSQPAPPGFSSDIGGSLGLGASTEVWQYVAGKPAQGLFAVPTLLPFTITLWGSSGNSGQMEFFVSCWRMR